jgi:hypothetical protein
VFFDVVPDLPKVWLSLVTFYEVRFSLEISTGIYYTGKSRSTVGPVLMKSWSVEW